MTATEHDLDRRLDAWFSATVEADGAPPAEPLARILAQTGAQRPRPSLAAGFGSHWVGGSGAYPDRGRIGGLRPALVIALVAVLMVALTGAMLFIGSRLRESSPGPIDGTSLRGFARAPDLPAAIDYPILAALPDDRVLVVDAQADTAYVYDPASGTTEAVGPMAGGEGAAGPTTRLADGRILILGDRVAQVFDPATLQFTVVGPQIIERRGPATAVLPDGRVLVEGGLELGSGYFEGQTSVELFDPRTGTFTSAGTFLMPHEVLATLPDGRVFATGADCCSTEVYDPTTETSHPAGSMPDDVLQGDGCCGPSRAVVVPDGRVFVFGTIRMGGAGYVAIWDPTTEDFTTAWKLPAPVYDARLLRDGRVLLIGGGRPTTWAGLFDPMTGETTAIKPPSAWLPTSALLSDGRVLVAGGLVDGAFRPDPSGSVGLDAPPVSTVEVLQ